MRGKERERGDRREKRCDRERGGGSGLSRFPLPLPFSHSLSPTQSLSLLPPSLSKSKGGGLLIDVGFHLTLSHTQTHAPTHTQQEQKGGPAHRLPGSTCHNTRPTGAVAVSRMEIIQDQQRVAVRRPMATEKQREAARAVQ